MASRVVPARVAPARAGLARAARAKGGGGTGERPRAQVVASPAGSRAEPGRGDVRGSRSQAGNGTTARKVAPKVSRGADRACRAVVRVSKEDPRVSKEAPRGCRATDPVDRAVRGRAMVNASASLPRAKEPVRMAMAGSALRARARARGRVGVSDSGFRVRLRTGQTTDGLEHAPRPHSGCGATSCSYVDIDHDRALSSTALNAS